MTYTGPVEPDDARITREQLKDYTREGLLGTIERLQKRIQEELPPSDSDVLAWWERERSRSQFHLTDGECSYLEQELAHIRDAYYRQIRAALNHGNQAPVLGRGESLQGQGACLLPGACPGVAAHARGGRPGRHAGPVAPGPGEQEGPAALGLTTTKKGLDT